MVYNIHLRKLLTPPLIYSIVDIFYANYPNNIKIKVKGN